MIVCIGCGAQNQSSLTICDYCGTELPKKEEAKKNKSKFNFIFDGLEEKLQEFLDKRNKHKYVLMSIRLIGEEAAILDVITPNQKKLGSIMLSDESSSYDFLLYVHNVKMEQGNGHIQLENLKKNDSLDSFSNASIKITYNEHGDYYQSPVVFNYYKKEDIKELARAISEIFVIGCGFTKNTKFNYDILSQNEPFVAGDDHNAGGDCFIATATMGDYDHPIVMDLRNFRDNWIMKKKWGSSFVRFYYKYGRYPANFISRKNWRKKISYHLIVKPLHMIVQMILPYTRYN